MVISPNINVNSLYIVILILILGSIGENFGKIHRISSNKMEATSVSKQGEFLEFSLTKNYSGLYIITL